MCSGQFGACHWLLPWAALVVLIVHTRTTHGAAAISNTHTHRTHASHTHVRSPSLIHVFSFIPILPHTIVKADPWHCFSMVTNARTYDFVVSSGNATSNTLSWVCGLRALAGVTKAEEVTRARATLLWELAAMRLRQQSSKLQVAPTKLLHDLVSSIDVQGRRARLDTA